jgi:acetyl esterase/lipase
VRRLLPFLVAGVFPAVAATAVPPAVLGAPAPGWKSFPINATGAYAERYVPASLDASRPAPVVVFLHGYLTLPKHYRPLVEPGAEATGAVVILPRSGGVTWGSAQDPLTIQESLRLVGEELALDRSRISIAGHSAGGAYAYLYAYGTVSKFNAVFTLAAPFYAVDQIADPEYTAPIRMYYGDGDPNYASAFPRLVEQWNELGVANESQIEAGYAHCCWPTAALVAGFEFLVSKRYPAGGCVPSSTRACLLDRFAVEVDWRTGGGASGPGQVASSSSANAGMFWFFDQENWEMLFKVLDGCAINGKFWVFAAATTDVELDLRVTDTTNGNNWSFENPLGRPVPPVQDTAALPCP